MIRRTSSVAASSTDSPSATFQPAASEAKRRANRTLHRVPTVVHHYARREDLALNAIHRDDPADDLWVPAAIGGIVLFIGGFAFWAGGQF